MHRSSPAVWMARSLAKRIRLQMHARPGVSNTYFPVLQGIQCTFFSSGLSTFSTATNKSRQAPHVTPVQDLQASIRQRILARSYAGQTRRTPYEVLGVDRSANDKDIKIAYFREAKKWHPDMNPGDAQAKEKFQEVAAAYEILRDPKKRADFDRYAASGGSTSGHQQSDWHQSAAYRQTNAEDVFRQVQQDAEVVKDALKLYFEELTDDLQYAGSTEWTCGLCRLITVRLVLFSGFSAKGRLE
jgi:hypothetical protein